MMIRFRAVTAALTLVALSAGTMTAATAGAAVVPAVSTLTQIRAAHQPGHDQVVFHFSGGLPAHYSARYVAEVIGDASGMPVNVVGRAKLLVRFTPAAGRFTVR